MVWRDAGTARLLPSLKIQLARTAVVNSQRAYPRSGIVRGDLVGTPRGDWLWGRGNQYGKTGRPPGSPDRTREEPTMGRTAATVQAWPRPPQDRAEGADSKPRESYRDTVEAIVVAFILALVVRGFEAQAFVIPTGSMAPTLMGRHKEVTCPQCGFVYTVNASEEVEGRSVSPPGLLGNLRQLPLPGARSDRGAQLQGRPHPGDDVPLRPAVPSRLVAPGAVGRRRLPLPRGARGQLHQAAGRPPRRDDPDQARRHLHQAARQRGASGSSGSR